MGQDKTVLLQVGSAIKRGSERQSLKEEEDEAEGLQVDSAIKRGPERESLKEEEEDEAEGKGKLVGKAEVASSKAEDKKEAKNKVAPDGGTHTGVQLTEGLSVEVESCPHKNWVKYVDDCTKYSDKIDTCARSFQWLAKGVFVGASNIKAPYHKYAKRCTVVGNWPFRACQARSDTNPCEKPAPTRSDCGRGTSIPTRECWRFECYDNIRGRQYTQTHFSSEEKCRAYQTKKSEREVDRDREERVSGHSLRNGDSCLCERPYANRQPSNAASSKKPKPVYTPGST